MPIEVVTNGNPNRPDDDINVARDGRDFLYLITNVEHRTDHHHADSLKFTFTNGWSISLIRGPYTYGGSANLWEMGVMDPSGSLDEDNPTTPNDVVGWLTNARVIEKMRRFANFTHEDLEKVKEYKTWLRFKRQVEDHKESLIHLWENAENLYHSDDEPLPAELQTAMDAIDAAFVRFAVEDPGIEDDSDE